MDNQRGNVFFYILLGIVLFAAISFAVSQSVRTNNGDVAMGATEKDSLAISDLIQYMDGLKTRTYFLSNAGVQENNLDFKNDVYVLSNGSAITDNINANCTTTDCHIFSPYAPDGITPVIFNDARVTTERTDTTYPKNGHGRVGEIIIDGVGSSAPDLVFVIYGIRPDICNAYNAKQGITTNYTASTTLTSIGESPSTSIPSSFSGFTTTNSFGTSATMFKGYKSFCAPATSDAADNRLSIWQVIKTR